MSVFRVMVVGDPHCAVDPPGSVNPVGYRDEYEGLWSQVLDQARSFRAHRVACTGDWFHRKGNTNHGDVRWMMRLLRPIVAEFGPVDTVAGNHDMQGHNVADSLERQPVAVLEAAGLVRRVDQSPYRIKVDAEWYGVCGSSYRGLAPGTLQPCASLGPAADGEPVASKLTGVFMLSHEDVELPRDESRVGRAMHQLKRVGYVPQPKFKPKPKPVLKDFTASSFVVCNGHIHNNLGELRCESRGGDQRVFVNVGCLNRTSSLEASCVPTLAAVMLGRGSVRVIRVPLRCRSADEAFPPSSRGESVEPQLDQMIEFLDPHDVSQTDPVTMVREHGRRTGASARHVEAAVRLVRDAVAGGV